MWIPDSASDRSVGNHFVETQQGEVKYIKARRFGTRMIAVWREGMKEPRVDQVMFAELNDDEILELLRWSSQFVK